ncbi:hypothetical protein JTE90_001805 [Oedothorax gibbosus]|uniref:E3 SUMO-protein ligase PIAS1 n=1 Tax=Oedothorax gibbosus TaxID=931172 RepID=A0AAV6VTA0_9ARAC|nr:hypothetical protein JTE90_001805 [Oedothorax gibbosus]
MAEAELRNMIMNFRVSDLQVLLGFAGRNKTGKKQELQYRALDLLKLKSSAVEMKVRELHNRRYHHQLSAPGSYDPQELVPVVERPPVHQYEAHVNNNYGRVRYNPNIRPAPHHQGPSSSHSSSSSKSYMVSSHSNHHQPPATAHRYNNAYNTYPCVKFKDMCFYENRYCLMPPCALPSQGEDRFQETTFYFTLTPEQAQKVAMSRNKNGHYEVQILLRFCIQDTTCEQEDFFPQNASVKLNSKQVSLPNPVPLNRPGVEPKRPSKPVNLTSCAKLSPTVTNVVHITWTATYGRSFAVGLFIARQLTATSLLQRLKSNGVRNPDVTTAMIKEKLKQGQDAEIATTNLRGSLICPLLKTRMEYPCRAITCNHLQCFDGLNYIQMNEKKPKWICPVCDKSAPFKSLALDGLFIDISSKVPSDCKEVQFDEDGSWTPVVEVKKEAKLEEKKKAKKSVEVVELLSDSESDDWTYELDQQTVKSVLGADSPPMSETDLFSLPPLPGSQLNPPVLPPAFPSTLEMSTASEANDSVCILPDDLNMANSMIPDLLPNNVDTSMPSTSSSSPGLNSAAFAQIPFLSDSLYQPDLNGTHTTTNYNNFDFLSLLQIPDVDPQKGKEYERNDSTTPDVISLD